MNHTCLAFVIYFVYVFGYFWHKTGLLRYIVKVLKNINIEPYCKKLALYLELFCHAAVLTNSHIIQFPKAFFARLRKNLLVSGLLEINELA